MIWRTARNNLTGSLRAILVGCCLGISGWCGAQVTQSVRGVVADELGRPLTHASIQLVGAGVYGSLSDSTGMFVIDKVPVGRYQASVSHLGFTTYTQELLVVGGKESQLRIALRVASIELKEIEVSETKSPSFEPGNYPLTIEQTMRVPANFFDPVRMATSLPGVVGTNDQSNSIAIKGYSPNAMLWRMDGLDIVNPNHLGNAGMLSDKPAATSGGVSIVSSQVLDKTQFYSGSLPVQYGNALSGAMDMQLRTGNPDKAEHTVQASLLGIDLATEGPLSKKNKNASYLLNYRYSTVGLLSAMGVNFGDEKINFQDLTFHLRWNSDRHQVSAFGFGGLSSNHFKAKPESEWKEEKDRYTIDYSGGTFGVGITDHVALAANSSLKLGVAYSGQDQDRTSLSEPAPLPVYDVSDSYNSRRFLLSSYARFIHQSSDNLLVEAGAFVTSMQQKLDIEEATNLYAYAKVGGNVNGELYQPYAAITYILPRLSIDAGVRYVYFSYNAGSSIEPRATLKTHLAKGDLALSYGTVSQVQQPQTYLTANNQGLGLTRAHQYLIQYRKTFTDHLSASLTGYYHQLIDVPTTSILTTTFSALNLLEDAPVGNLRNDGFGRNYGVEGMVEKKFVNKLYFLLAGSWYKSGYADAGKTYYTTRFSGTYNSSVSAGKEWTRGDKSFGLHARAIVFGGLREMKVDSASSAVFGTTSYAPGGYTQKLPDYYRVDLRLSWRKNRPGYTRTISIDIQNVTNHENAAYHYYDTYLQKVVLKNQLGLIPVLIYRVDF